LFCEVPKSLKRRIIRISPEKDEKVAPLPTDRTAWRYTDDDNNNYAVAAQKAITDQLSVGGAAANPADPALPIGFKMRRINVVSATGQHRQVVLYTTAATLKPKGQTINLNYNSNSMAFTSTGNMFKERPQRRSTILELD
jgi:hypothetical protein